MEINATSGLLNDITKLNEELRHEAKQNAITQFISELVTGLAEKAVAKSSIEACDDHTGTSSPEEGIMTYEKISTDVQAGRPMDGTPEETYDDNDKSNDDQVEEKN